MAKHDKEQEAITLRVEQRLSIKDIAEQLQVAKSSVSLWLRDYPLSEQEVRERHGCKGLRKISCRFCNVDIETYSCRQAFCSDSCRTKYKYRKRVTNGEHVVTWRQKVKLRAVDYKGGQCQVCGYKRCIGALKFHHLDPNEKDFQISGNSLSWELIKKELDKCVLVCGNCHDEIHAGLVSIGM